MRAFASHPAIDRLLVVIHPDDEDLYEKAAREAVREAAIDPQKLLASVHGGATRQLSVLNGLEALAKLSPIPARALIHDAARPFVSHELIGAVLEALETHQAALPLLPVADTIKQAERGGGAADASAAGGSEAGSIMVTATPDRSRLFAAQTPQGFHFPLLLELHRRAAAASGAGIGFTDDASIAEWAGVEVCGVAGDEENFKLTTPRDMRLAELWLKAGDKRGETEQTMEFRTGMGFDVHAFEEGGEVILCGVKIPFDKSLRGHSDADVAMHALTDAIFGAMGAGDIGEHFPPTDEKWRDAPSSIFLQGAMDMLRERGGRLVNLDLTIICEKPKIGPHREAMRENLAAIMQIGKERVSIKATTSEKLGFTGRGEGIAAQAIITAQLPVS
jgi:2-C-methyl-D-erythritol 4-phosphate cytidylyltransferase/2-C-methyl-D-erythritol 2,4-cyclodiphosphate synthase